MRCNHVRYPRALGLDGSRNSHQRTATQRNAPLSLIGDGRQADRQTDRRQKQRLETGTEEKKKRSKKIGREMRGATDSRTGTGVCLRGSNVTPPKKDGDPPGSTAWLAGKLRPQNSLAGWEESLRPRADLSACGETSRSGTRSMPHWSLGLCLAHSGSKMRESRVVFPRALSVAHGEL